MTADGRVAGSRRQGVGDGGGGAPARLRALHQARLRHQRASIDRPDQSNQINLIKSDQSQEAESPDAVDTQILDDEEASLLSDDGATTSPRNSSSGAALVCGVEWNVIHFSFLILRYSKAQDHQTAKSRSIQPTM